MRILFISNLYPPGDLGGMEQICEEIVGRLRQRGHICHVLTSRFGSEHVHEPEPDVTRTLYLEADIYYYRPLDFFLHRPWQERSNHRTLQMTVDSFHPDVIFIWGMWNLSRRLAREAEQCLPNRVAYNIQGYWPLEDDPHRYFWRQPTTNPIARVIMWPFTQLVLGILAAENYPPPLELAHVSCCSQYVVDLLTNANAIPPGAMAILNGIDPSPFLSNPRQGLSESETLRLLYFGSLIESKGVHTAIEAVGLLQQQGQADRLHLTIIGGGHPDYEAYLQTLVKSYALEDKVDFVGRVPRSQIAQNLAQHDIFLFTSTYAEPFGRTIIEAMTSGLAVIGSDVGGSKEIFRYYPENMLFEPGDAKALALQIHRFVKDPALLERLAEAGRRIVLEHFTLDRMVDEMEAWLQEVVAA